MQSRSRLSFELPMHRSTYLTWKVFRIVKCYMSPILCSHPKINSENTNSLRLTSLTIVLCVCWHVASPNLLHHRTQEYYCNFMPVSISRKKFIDFLKRWNPLEAPFFAADLATFEVKYCVFIHRFQYVFSISFWDSTHLHIVQKIYALAVLDFAPICWVLFWWDRDGSKTFFTHLFRKINGLQRKTWKVSIFLWNSKSSNFDANTSSKSVQSASIDESSKIFYEFWIVQIE